MSIRILKAGVLDSLQDHGRYGYAYLGINPGGTMDRLAAQAANALVGNDPTTAVLEMHLPAAEILFEQTTLMALAGADVEAFINGEPIPTLVPVVISKGAVLSFGERKSGARIYLSVRHGFDLQPWLNSYSTNIKAGAGGWKGRRLVKEDVIPFHLSLPAPPGAFKILPWSANVASLYSNDTIRFIAGKQFELLDEQAVQQLTQQSYLITRESDRMGYRLQAAPLSVTTQVEMISSAVTRGTMQLLPNGQLIILMADHQTTGGYPVIGHIISADLPTLAQLQPGESFSIQQVSLNTAETAMLNRQKDLHQLQNACTFRLHQYGLR